MPRPPDTYTHSQFTSIDPDNVNGQAETGRCNHCKSWQGNIRALSRKKEHLLKCPQYAEWRAAGNGQDLAPPNSYNKRNSSALDNEQDQQQPYYAPYADYGAAYGGYQQPAPPMPRPKNPDVNVSYEEFFDEGNKCTRVRCKHCGFVRAKNSTRQVEHLLNCRDFLNSPEGQQAAQNGELNPVVPADNMTRNLPGQNIYQGKAPNPHLTVNNGRRGPYKPRVSGGAPATPLRPMPPPGPPQPMPSLANHLLGRDTAAVAAATQSQFLSHAGCGTLSAPALMQWLTQDAHISRAFVSFVGTLIGKVRLPETSNSQQHTTYRAMDLLISTLNNVRREMSFFEVNAGKYGLSIGGEEIKPATKAYLDLFASASSPSASLLEGMVVLWATEHLYRASWHYASTFTNTLPSSTYSLPSYLTSSQGDVSNPFGPNASSSSNNDAHINALQQALIPNWTSPAFSKFVDACRAIVDELANAQTSGNGREEMQRCESVFKQQLWLWARLWPEVNGMGEEEVLAAERERLDPSTTPAFGGKKANGAGDNNNEEPIEVQDDEEDNGSGNGQDAEAEENHLTPYGGTGLGAVHAANQVA